MPQPDCDPQLDPGEQSVTLEARSTITAALLLWYTIERSNIEYDISQADRWLTILNSHAPPLDQFGLTAAATLATFVHLHPLHHMFDPRHTSALESGATMLHGVAAPSIWLVGFMRVHGDLPRNCSAQETEKLLQQSLPKFQEHQKLSGSKDRYPSAITRLLMMIILLKTAALLTCIAYPSKSVTAALAILWHMMGQLVQQARADRTSQLQAVKELDSELRASPLVVELTVPLLRQSVTAHKSGSKTDTFTNLLQTSVSLDILGSLLECASPEMRHAVAAQMLKQGMSPAKDCSEPRGFKAFLLTVNTSGVAGQQHFMTAVMAPVAFIGQTQSCQ